MGIRWLTVVSSVVLGSALVVGGGACKKKDGEAGGKSKSKPPEAKKSPSGVAAAEDVCAKAKPATKGPIRWFKDDYPSALACAKKHNKPLLIDAWAPWCHTCLSMKHYILVDKAFEPFADRFVWLAVDTDKAINAAVVGKYPQQFWPTFFIVSPDETVQGRYQGAASVPQFREFLKQGEAGHLAGAKTIEDPALELVRKGDRAALARDWPAAATAYESAITTNKDQAWSRKADVAVAFAGAAYQSKNWGQCLSAGRFLSALPNTSSTADLIYFLGVCAAKVDKDDKLAPVAAKLIATAEKRLTALVNDGDAPLSIDDRADAMRILRGMIEKRGDKKTARDWALKQRKLLDEASAAAPNAFVAMTYNWPRAEVYVYLDQAKDLINDLEASVKALPKQYDPPYRLAWIYLKSGDNTKALDMAERALGLAYGPRKARVQSLVASIHKARGDAKAEREARAKVVEIYEKLPAGQQKPAALERAKKALAELKS